MAEGTINPNAARITRRGLLGSGVAGAITIPAMVQARRPFGPAYQTRLTVFATNGIAATSHPLATGIALDLLRAGGSAVDAAIGANAALGLMEPVGAGAGGDLFAMIWDPEAGKLEALNATGPAPLNRSLADLSAALPGQKMIPPVGTAPLTVPGVVDGWVKAHERYGKLSLKQVLAPAIDYAREGFPVSPITSRNWARNLRILGEMRGQIEEYDNTLATWAIDGKAPGAGQLFRNPDLARTYEAIAADGRASFYEGEIAARLVAYMQQIGGPITAADMANYEAQWVTPISAPYRSFDIFQMPPNSQGVTALQMLRIFDGYDFASLSETDRVHVMIEAKKRAFLDRTRYLADPAFANIPVAQLLSDEHIAAMRGAISLDRANPVSAGRTEEGDTVFLGVADADGMMVSWIQSNYRGMGAGLTPTGLGFMLQNRGSQFSLDPAHANAYAPGKRPFHTNIPGFVMKAGRPLISYGLIGGPMQPQGHIQILSNLLDRGTSLQAAGDAPRWRHNGGSDPDGREPRESEVIVEEGFDAKIMRELAERGHTVRIDKRPEFGAYQAVARLPSSWAAASDSRKDGMAAGY